MATLELEAKVKEVQEAESRRSRGATLREFPYAPCMEYLPTKLGDFVRAKVGKYNIHGTYGIGYVAA